MFPTGLNLRAPVLSRQLILSIEARDLDDNRVFGSIDCHHDFSRAAIALACRFHYARKGHNYMQTKMKDKLRFK